MTTTTRIWTTTKTRRVGLKPDLQRAMSLV
jgi:hypothetical protein